MEDGNPPGESSPLLAGAFDLKRKACLTPTEPRRETSTQLPEGKISLRRK
jgi:hypothetical protein